MKREEVRRWLEIAGRVGVLRKARSREYQFGDFSESWLRMTKATAATVAPKEKG